MGALLTLDFAVLAMVYHVLFKFSKARQVPCAGVCATMFLRCRVQVRQGQALGLSNDYLLVKAPQGSCQRLWGPQSAALGRILWCGADLL